MPSKTRLTVEFREGLCSIFEVPGDPPDYGNGRDRLQFIDVNGIAYAIPWDVIKIVTEEKTNGDRER